MGGVARRATKIREAEGEDREILILGLGDFAGKPTDQGRVKSSVSLDAMKKMHYDALVLGERELALGDEFVLKTMKKSGIPIVDTNMKYNGKQFGRKDLIIKRGGIKIGIEGVTLDQLRVGQEEWTVQDPFEALAEAIPRLRKKVDLVVVMSHLGYRQSVALAESQEGIDVVVVGHQGRRVKTPVSVGGAIMAQSGDKSKYLGRIDLTFDRKAGEIVEFSGELVPLDAKVADDEEMARLYSDYQSTVKEMVKNDVDARRGQLKGSEAGYMGAVWCRSCHAEIYEKWNATGHARAFLTLKKEGEEYNPECVKCHTTGYQKGGFVTIDETPNFNNVQCEQCHGPASRHIADKGKAPLQAGNVFVCITCHTGERGEGFDYEVMKGLVH